MKDINVVLRQKVAEMERVKQELSALYTVIPLVAEPGDPALVPKAEVKAS